MRRLMMVAALVLCVLALAPVACASMSPGYIEGRTVEVLKKRIAFTHLGLRVLGVRCQRNGSGFFCVARLSGANTLYYLVTVKDGNIDWEIQR